MFYKNKFFFIASFEFDDFRYYNLFLLVERHY